VSKCFVHIKFTGIVSDILHYFHVYIIVDLHVFLHAGMFVIILCKKFYMSHFLIH